jgi:hypothetical protein
VSRIKYLSCPIITALDPASGHLVYINGGHEPLYVIGRKDGVKKELPLTGPAVGLMENFNFKAQWLQLDPGDLLLGFTDGVTESCNSEEEFFTRTRVKDILAQPMASARDLLDRILQQVFDFVDTAPRSEDITMLAIQRVVKCRIRNYIIRVQKLQKSKLRKRGSQKLISSDLFLQHYRNRSQPTVSTR